MEQAEYKGDVLQKIGGVSFIVGSILLIVFNILLPRVDDPGDMGEIIQKVADKSGGFWEASHLLLAVGLWGLMIGVVSVYRSLSTGSAAPWARLGFCGVVVGTTLWTVVLGLDGAGLARVAESWQSATGEQKETLFIVATSLRSFETGLFSLTIMAYWLALVSLGIGMVLSTLYPKWLSGAIILLGAALVVVGVIFTFADNSTALDSTFGILAGISTIWALVLGLWITRREIKAM